MTVEEAKKAKREAELKILGIVSDFQKASGLDVTNINTQAVEMASFGEPPRRAVFDVSLDCRV